MRFFFDNNLSPHLAKGMREFGQDAAHLTEHFAPAEKDEVWLRHLGANGWILVTRDERIRWNPAEIRALRDEGVGAFFLGGKNRSRCDLIEQVVRNWRRMKDYATRTTKPFAFRIPPSGTKFSRIQL